MPLEFLAHPVARSAMLRTDLPFLSVCCGLPPGDYVRGARCEYVGGSYVLERYKVKKKKGAAPRSAKSAKKVAPKVVAKSARVAARKAVVSKRIAKPKKLDRKTAVSAKVAPRAVESAPVAVVAEVEAPVVSAPPPRAPARKIIREGKVEVVAAVVQTPSREALKADLLIAWERFSEAASQPAVEGRNFADFWVGEGPIPSAVARECGELRAVELAQIAEGFDGAEERAFVESLHRAAGAAIETPPEAEQRKALRTHVPLEPSWKNDKANYPLLVRALLGLVEWQCRLAGTWPFAFARFMAKVPQRMGSDEFVALAFAVDRPAAEVGELLGLSTAELDALIERAREQLIGVFESECSDVHRQWNIALRGAGVAVDHLVQRYLVDSLSREFQMLLGRMTAAAMVAGLSSENGVSANGWGVGAVA